MKLKTKILLAILISVILATVSIAVYCIIQLKNLTVQFSKNKIIMDSYNKENDLIIVKMNEINEYVKFLEQSIPDIQKRNAKALVIKNIAQENFSLTKINSFKSERELNDFTLSIVEYSEKFNVPASLLLAVARSESNLNPRAVSSSGAKGISQLMPETIDRCLKFNNKIDYDVFYVKDSVFCSAWYLKQIKNTLQDTDLVIRAYNVGPNFILKFNGSNLPEETVKYHQTVSSFMQKYKEKIFWEK